MSFSLKYDPLNDVDVQRAILWDSRERTWKITERAVHSFIWYSVGGLNSDEEAKSKLLQRFGLSFFDLKPDENLSWISPADLMSRRRTKEQAFNLNRIEVTSDDKGSEKERAEDNL